SHHTLACWAYILPPERPGTHGWPINSRHSFINNAYLRLGKFLWFSCSLQAVVFTDIIKRFLQILNEPHRSKLFSTARAALHLCSFAGAPVQFDTHCCRALDDMEKFPKW